MAGYHIERRGTDYAPWTLVHTLSGLTISVERPYDGHSDVPLPPYQVANHRSRALAHAAATEIDWDALDERYDADPAIQAQAIYERERRDFDARYQAACVAARAGTGPWPWERDGMLHNPVCLVAPTLGRTDPERCPVCGADRPETP